MALAWKQEREENVQYYAETGKSREKNSFLLGKLVLDSQFFQKKLMRVYLLNTKLLKMLCFGNV